MKPLEARKDLPPPSLPLVGHLPWFLLNRLKFLETCARQSADVVRLNLFGETYLLTNADDIKYVLVTNPDNYDKTPRMTSRRGKLVSGDGLLTASAADHLRERRMLQPVFYRTGLRKFSSIISCTAEEILDAWKPGEEIEVGEEMARLAQRVIIRTVFGTDFRDRNGLLAEAINGRKRYLDHIFFSLMPMAHYLPPWTWWRYRKAMQYISAVITHEIRLRRDQAGQGDDLLTQLMRARYEDGTGMTDRRLHDEALILLITGYESIGDALIWLLYCLSNHPEVEHKLFTEVSTVLGNRPPCADDLQNLPYTARVLAETLRLYPPSWIMVRIARDNDTLPSGTLVPASAKLYLSQYIIHRHPRYYKEPARFDPERFNETASKDRPQFAYFPFGGGPRACIGEHFARLEATLVLAMAVQRFTLHPSSGQDLALYPRMTLRPKKGFHMLVERRS
jgi:cytochrome P450